LIGADMKNLWQTSKMLHFHGLLAYLI